MLRVGGFVTIGYNRLPPRTVSVRTLFSPSISPGVGIICLRHAPAPVRTVCGSTSGVCPSVRIVGSTGRGSSVRAVNSFSCSVSAGICIIVRTYAVSGSIRMIDGVSTHRITVVGRIVIAGAAGEDRSNGGASYERSQISRGVARLESALGGGGLGHIGDVVNRRAGRNRVDFFRN